MHVLGDTRVLCISLTGRPGGPGAKRRGGHHHQTVASCKALAGCRASQAKCVSRGA